MSSLVAGHSLLNVPMDEIARELSALSWVSAVDVYRVWPHGLIVRVTEKVPVAHWNGDGFISHTGDVFQPENAGDVGALPMLAGPADKARHVMAFYSVPLTLIVLASLPLYVALSLVVTPILRRRLDVKFARGAESQALLVETVTGIQTAKHTSPSCSAAAM